MATSPIGPHGFPSVAQSTPTIGREMVPRAAPFHGAAARPSRPAESLEIQLARIFARHAMQAQRASQAAETSVAISGRTRGENLDIFA